MNESTKSIQLDVTRSGQFNEIYHPLVEYSISMTTNGSSTAIGIYL